jgi:ribonuclease HI
MLSVYSDGSSTDRSGRAGGWAYVVVRDGTVLCEGTGGARATNGNAMELEAARAGVQAAIAERSLGEAIELVTDSQVALEALREECASEKISLRWVRGHSGDAWNERVDALASAAKQAFIPARVLRKSAARAAKKSHR